MAEFERLWKIYKVTDFEIKYITTVDWDNFTTDIVDDSMRSKNLVDKTDIVDDSMRSKNLVDKTDISGLINNADLNKKTGNISCESWIKSRIK